MRGQVSWAENVYPEGRDDERKNVRLEIGKEKDRDRRTKVFYQGGKLLEGREWHESLKGWKGGTQKGSGGCNDDQSQRGAKIEETRTSVCSWGKPGRTIGLRDEGNRTSKLSIAETGGRRENV